MASLMPKTAAKSGTVVEQQLSMVFVLKEQLNLLYRQMNHFKGACKSVDRLNRTVKRMFLQEHSKLGTDKLITEFFKFERNYRVSRKRFRRLDRKLLKVNLFDKLYDLYKSLVVAESPAITVPSSSVVDQTNSFSMPMRIENTSVHNFAHIPVGYEIQLNTRPQLESSITTNYAAPIDSSLSSLSSSSSSFLVAANVSSMNSQKFQCIPTTNQRIFQCDQCGISFNCESTLSRHKLTHLNDPLYRCMVENYGYGTHHPITTSSSSTSSFKAPEIPAVHTTTTQRRTFRCDQCPKLFKTSPNLAQHKLTHANEPRYRCSWVGCQFRANHPSRIKTHAMSAHAGQRPFQCLQCDKTFKSASCLSHHKRTHKSEQQYRCSWQGCDYRTNHHNLFKDHLNVHTGERPFTCDQCLKSFKSLSNLSHHKRTHGGWTRFPGAAQT